MRKTCCFRLALLMASSRGDYSRKEIRGLV